ncbi:YheT family hydrolase [Geminocystis herdmanii]|uniref:YheT family hydrolase n=1 Tax=Geminocystis herdmanii TaxID=669359 RepID=UPI0003495152|nr:alpha/beta fold hydrolase [Geminocystis herdmanii]
MSSYQPPFFLRNGLIQTLYVAFWMSRHWQKTTNLVEPNYQEHIFKGANDVPIFGLVAIPDNPRGTIVGTYGITGDLDNQWYLRLLGRKAYAQGYAVVLFDWRAHGKTALLSPALTSDGLLEGKDFMYIASQAKTMGCPAQFWFTGYSLGGKLALWALYEASRSNIEEIYKLRAGDIGGGAVICPSLDAMRSLTYLENHPWGRYLEKAITQNLKKLVTEIAKAHPQHIDREILTKINSIKEFDQYLVIPALGFNTVAEYYHASSPLNIMGDINKPTLILYAIDDPMFDPTLVDDLVKIGNKNPMVDLILTKNGGHVGYISNLSYQQEYQDVDEKVTQLDRWWAWNLCLDWFNLKGVN